MGSVLGAVCPCGFESEEIYAGGGMLDFHEVCNAPAFCQQCRDLVVVNYLLANPKCLGCSGPVVFYDDPSLQAAKGSREQEDPRRDVFNWNASDEKHLRLPGTKYLCPKCGRKRMTFVFLGNFD